MFSVTWIASDGVLESCNTSSYYSAIVLRNVLLIMFRSVRIWKGSKLVS